MYKSRWVIDDSLCLKAAGKSPRPSIRLDLRLFGKYFDLIVLSYSAYNLFQK